MNANGMVKVWDPLVRLFHWSLVVLFVIAYLTGEEDNDLHIYAGYAVLGLVVFRILWGIVGSRHARFSDFVYGPGATIRYALGVIRGRPEHYLGHNPLGGYMALLLLVMLLVVTVSGLKVYGLEGHGPLAAAPRIALIADAGADTGEEHEVEVEHEEEKNDAEAYWEEIHEVASNITVALVVLHILGVVVSSRVHGENLVRAMITGRKKALPPA